MKGSSIPVKDLMSIPCHRCHTPNAWINTRPWQANRAHRGWKVDWLCQAKKCHTVANSEGDNLNKLFLHFVWYQLFVIHLLAINTYTSIFTFKLPPFFKYTGYMIKANLKASMAWVNVGLLVWNQTQWEGQNPLYCPTGRRGKSVRVFTHALYVDTCIEIDPQLGLEVL